MIVAPRSWVETVYPGLAYLNEVARGRALCRLGEAGTLLRRGVGRVPPPAHTGDP